VVDVKLKSYLQLFRAQTYPASMLCVLVPYLYGNGFDAVALMLVILSIPMHYFSFGHNSVMDYWFDKDDPNKRHHPLEDGRIKILDAHNVVQTGMMLFSIVYMLVTLFFAKNTVMALAFLLMYIVFGHGYNDGLGKSTIFSFAPISLCFTSLAGFGWFMGHESIDYIGVLMLVYVFFNIFYQIAWEGNLKDIEADRVNLLKKMGVREYSFALSSVVYVSPLAQAFSALTRIIIFVLGTVLALHTGNFIGVILLIASAYPTIKIMSTRIPWGEKRDDALMNMSLVEICTIYALMFTVIRLDYAIILGAYGLAYFVGVNKMLWGKPHPKV
jgi:4-hydroxybenzoate polyprenyltransferase